MVPGNGIIVKTDSSAASGASVSDYHLGGYQTSAVTHPSAWTVSDLQVGFLSGPMLRVYTCVQTLALCTCGRARRCRGRSSGSSMAKATSPQEATGVLQGRSDCTPFKKAAGTALCDD